MNYLALLIISIVAGGLQVGVLPYALVMAVVYVGFLFLPFIEVAWMAFVAGLALDVYVAGRMGVSSVILLAMVGILRLWVSQGRSGEQRAGLQDLVVYVPIAVVEAIIAGGGVTRFIGNMIAVVVMYGLASYLVGRSDLIKVRRTV